MLYKINKLNFSRLVILSAAGLAYLSALPGKVFAQANPPAINTGLDTTANAAFGSQILDKDLTSIIGDVISIVLGFVGIIFFGIVIYGGVTLMVAGGSKEKVKKGMDMIVNGGVGVMIIAAAYVISYFVIGTLLK